MDEKLTVESFHISFDFYNPQVKTPDVSPAILFMNLIEKILSGIALTLIKTSEVEKPTADSLAAILPRIEKALRKYSYKHLNYIGVNYRNSLFQQLFKIFGVMN